MVASSVARISPLLQGRNGYLPSIGWRDRFLVEKEKKNKQNRTEIQNKNQRKMKPLCKQGQGLAPIPCKNMLENLQTNMGYIKLNKQNKINILTSFGGMGHHALAGRSTSLSLSWQWGSYGSMEGWMRGSVGGLRDKGSQGIHSGSITVCKGENVLRGTPTPLFIAFLGHFRVLSPWLGLQPLSPYLQLLLGFLAPLRGFKPFFSFLILFKGVGVQWGEMRVVHGCPWVVQAMQS